MSEQNENTTEPGGIGNDNGAVVESPGTGTTTMPDDHDFIVIPPTSLDDIVESQPVISVTEQLAAAEPMVNTETIDDETVAASEDYIEFLEESPNVFPSRQISFKPKSSYITDPSAAKPVFLPAMPRAMFTDFAKQVIIENTEEALAEFKNTYMYPGIVAGNSNDPHSPELDSKTAHGEREWVQEIKHGEAVLKAGKVQGPRSVATGTVLSGAQAVDHFAIRNNRGPRVRINLWHSGFTVMLTAPSDHTLFNMDDELSSAKIKFGRATYGLALANEIVYSRKALWELIEPHMTAITLDKTEFANESLSDYIDIQDFNLLVAGLGELVYPDGFNYIKTLPGNDRNGGPELTFEQAISPLRSIIVDHKALTAWQLDHMSNQSQPKMTKASLKRYRAEMQRGNNKRIQLLPELHVTLASPTISQYFRSGERWLYDLGRMAESSFTEEGLDTAARIRRISLAAMTTTLRNYAHWVTSVIDTDENSVIDTDTIEKLLDQNSSIPGVAEQLIKSVTDYMGEIAVATTATPICPPEVEDNPRFRGYVAYDPAAVFFTLVDQRKQQLVNS